MFLVSNQGLQLNWTPIKSTPNHCLSLYLLPVLKYCKKYILIIGWQCCGLILFVVQILFSFSSNLITFAKEKGIKQKTKLNQTSFRKAIMVLLLLLLKYYKKLLWYCIKCLATAPAAIVSLLYGHSKSESESHLEGRGLFSVRFWSSVISCTLVLTFGRSRGGGGCHPPLRFFWFFS